MCGTRLKMLSALLVLFSLLLFSPASPCLYAEKNVTLTQEEAQELMKLIEESEKDLTEAQKELQDARNDYIEQKKSYEEQLKEEKRKNKNLKIGTVVTGTSSAVMSVVCTVLLIIIL